MRLKSQQSQRRVLRALALLVLAVGGARAEMQHVSDGEDSLPSLTFPQMRYLRTDFEFEQIDSQPSSGSGTRTQRMYVSPTAGIAWSYYLYHPNLLTYQLLAEPGYVWQEYATSSGTTSQNIWMVNGSFTAALLPTKPYSWNFNYSRSHGEYHYDFFNSATVDTESFGVATGYRQGPVPFTVSLQHTSTDNSGLLYDSSNKQMNINFHAENQRSRGNSDLLYQYSDYSGVYGGTSSFNSEESTHSLTLADIEHLSPKVSLDTTIYYTRYDSQGQVSDNPSAALDLNWEMSPYLRSFYDASVSDYLTVGSSSLNTSLRAGLQHQLFESLSSTLEVHGGDSRTDAGDSRLAADTVGVSLAEGYNKRLGEWGNLSINNTVGYDYTMQTSSGGVLPVFDESHAVGVGGLLLTPLNLPRVVSITAVIYQDGINQLPLVSGDYDILTAGELTRLQLTPSGLAKLAAASPPATSVKVSYTVQPNPSGNYSTFNNQTEIRLGFWKQRASIFVRYTFNDNQADTAGFVLDNYNELQAGGDLSWNRLRLNATYTDRHSSLYGYQSLTTTENWTVFSSFKDTFALDFNQQWNRFDNGGGSSASDLAYYAFTAHYGWHPLDWLNWQNEIGYELQRGSGSERDDIVARSHLTATLGKLEMNLGYEYENQKYTGETRGRNFAYIRLKRNF
jgi:hypothetical protein